KMEASIPTIIMTTWNGLLWHHYGPMRLPRIRNFWKPPRSFGKTLRKVGMIIRAVALPGEKPSWITKIRQPMHLRLFWRHGFMNYNKNQKIWNGLKRYTNGRNPLSLTASVDWPGTGSIGTGTKRSTRTGNSPIIKGYLSVPPWLFLNKQANRYILTTPLRQLTLRFLMEEWLLEES